MTNTSKKTTKKDYYAMLLRIEEVNANPELVNFINHELELLDKKASRSKSKNDAEKSALLEAILEEFATLNRKMTVSEYLKVSKVCEANGITATQKATPLLKKLTSIGMLLNTTEKKKSVYFINPEVEVETESDDTDFDFDDEA